MGIQGQTPSPSAASDEAESFDRALRGARVRDENLNELARLVDAIKGAEASARPEFVSDLRAHLLAQAAQPAATAPLQPQPAEPARRTRTRAAAVLIAAAIAASTSGVAAAADSAQPGSLLYPVKRGLETIQIEAQSDAGSKGRAQLRLAELRLQEARASQDGEALKSFGTFAEQGAKELFRNYQSTSDRANIITVRAFADDSLQVLREIAEDAPEQRATIRDLAQALVDYEAEAHTMCASCTPPPSQTDLTNHG